MSLKAIEKNKIVPPWDHSVGFVSGCQTMIWLQSRATVFTLWSTYIWLTYITNILFKTAVFLLSIYHYSENSLCNTVNANWTIQSQGKLLVIDWSSQNFARGLADVCWIWSLTFTKLFALPSTFCFEFINILVTVRVQPFQSHWPSLTIFFCTKAGRNFTDTVYAS